MRSVANSVWTFVALLIVAAITVVAGPAGDDGPGPSEVAGTPVSTTATALTEYAAPIVVEADHGAASPGEAPRIGRHGALSVDPDVQAAMERHADEVDRVTERTEQTMIGAPPAHYGALFGGVSVEYNSTYPAPSNVRTVVDSVISQWDSLLSTNPSGPITVEVIWAALGNSSLLGYAGPDGMFFGGGLPSGALFPAPLANTLLGTDVNGPDRPEIQVVLNSELASNGRWYIGTTGSPAGGQIDLHSVVLHEVAHGLGFLGSADIEEGQTQPSLNSPPFAYDTLASHNGVPLTSYANPAAALTSGDLQAAASSGITLDLYAPGSWSTGSSFSHFDESAYTAGAAGALMTPMLAGGETNRTVDAVTLGVLARSGWPIAVDAATPSIVTTTTSTNSVTLLWNQNLTQPAVAPDSYTVEAWRNGTVLQSSTSVPGSSASGTIGSLSAGGSYTIQVVPSGPGGTGSPAAVNVTLPSDGGDPAPSYVRYRPLDGQISRLYQAYFLRQPDQGGFDYWVDQRAQPNPLAALSNAFASSAEFVSRYGSVSDEQFVDLIYGNVLQRTPDPEGRAYWIGQLAAGVSRGAVMIGFAESNEFITRTDTAPPTSAGQGKIERLYQAFFLRAPDTEGLNYWVGQADAGVSLETIAAAFTQSPEFQSRYGSLGNQAFVTLVYNNVLGRAPDAGGLSYWTGQLAAGLGRGPMMVQFSESVEFIKSTGTIP